MSFPVDIMDETLSLSHKTGESGIGPVYAVAVDVDAYVEPDERIIKNANGVEVVCSLFAVVGSDTVVAAGDKGVHGGQLYEVVKVNAFAACGTEPGHIELNLKSVAA